MRNRSTRCCAGLIEAHVCRLSWFHIGKGEHHHLYSADVSAASNMAGMFMRVTAFNVDVSNWDVSSVANMASMFNDATLFKSDVCVCVCVLVRACYDMCVCACVC